MQRRELGDCVAYCGQLTCWLAIFSVATNCQKHNEMKIGKWNFEIWNKRGQRCFVWLLVTFCNFYSFRLLCGIVEVVDGNRKNCNIFLFAYLFLAIIIILWLRF